LSGRWDRFSWFGVRKVNNKDGSLADIPESRIEYSSFIGALEAVLIEGLEPPLNRRTGEGFGSTESIEWHQKEDPMIVEKRNRAWLEKQAGTSLIGQSQQYVDDLSKEAGKTALNHISC
jgi:hypothetical protein